MSSARRLATMRRAPQREGGPPGGRGSTPNAAPQASSLRDILDRTAPAARWVSTLPWPTYAGQFVRSHGIMRGAVRSAMTKSAPCEARRREDQRKLAASETPDFARTNECLSRHARFNERSGDTWQRSTNWYSLCPTDSSRFSEKLSSQRNAIASDY